MIKTDTDITEIYDVETQCFEDAWSYKMLSDEAEKENSYIFSAVKDDKCIGYILLNTCLDEAEILKICVLESYRGCGIGKELIDFACNYLKNINIINLEVRKSNTPAIKLYEKCGFLKVGERKNYYKNNEDAVLMTKLCGED